MPYTYTDAEVDDRTKSTAQVVELGIHMHPGQPVRVTGVIVLCNPAGETVEHIAFDEYGDDVDAAVAGVYDDVKTALYGLLKDLAILPAGTVS